MVRGLELLLALVRIFYAGRVRKKYMSVIQPYDAFYGFPGKLVKPRHDRYRRYRGIKDIVGTEVYRCGRYRRYKRYRRYRKYIWKKKSSNRYIIASEGERESEKDGQRAYRQSEGAREKMHRGHTDKVRVRAKPPIPPIPPKSAEPPEVPKPRELPQLQKSPELTQPSEPPDPPVPLYLLYLSCLGLIEFPGKP